MSLSLYVLRHAKAEDPVSGTSDHERALKRRGRKSAQLVGRTLARLGETPELVLCSTAVRARETAEAAGAAGGWKAPVELRETLYLTGPDELLRELAALDEAVERVLLVGHQPGLALLIGELTGHEPVFPTAALARVDFELKRWSELAPRSGRLVWMVTPELLGTLRSRSAK